MVKKDKWISIILCLFFGWTGAHRFYEGKIMLGILYFLTFGFVIVWVIDLIELFGKPDPYYVHKPSENPFFGI